MSRTSLVEKGGFAVVTGGSSGIGLAAARRLAEKGMSLALVARDPNRLQRAREDVVAAVPGAEVATYTADLSDWEQAKAAMDRVVAEQGVPEVLVNSAGVIYPGEFVSMPLEDFQINIDCGFWSIVYPCRALAPLMMQQGRGHIVNVSSVAGFLGIYGYTGYSASKYAVVGFSEALRFEMRPHGVFVSVVCPPDTDTPALAFERTLRPKETDVIAGNIKPIAPDKVATAIARVLGKDRFMVIPDRLSAVYFRLKGLVPELFYSIVDGDVAKARSSR